MSIALVQEGSGNVAASNNIAVTMAGGRTADSCLVALIASDQANAVTGITDASNAWIAAYIGTRYEVWVCPHNRLTTTTFTITRTIISAGSAIVLELSGVSTYNVVEAVGGLLGTSATPDAAATGFNTTQTALALVGVMNEDSTAAQSSPTNGYTQYGTELTQAGGAVSHRNYAWGKLLDEYSIEELEVTLPGAKAWESVILILREIPDTVGLSLEDSLESISGDVALEPPQTKVAWEFREEFPDLTYLHLRRSTYRYPENAAEGDSILAEAQDNSDLRTSYADASVEAMKTYYYSLFSQYYGPFSSNKKFEYDLERLGTPISAKTQCCWVEDSVVGTGNNILVTFAGTLEQKLKPFSVNFTLVDGVVQTVQDDGIGGWTGYAVAGYVNYETGAYSVTFTGAPDAAEDIYADYAYDDGSYWIAASSAGDTVLWSYNSVTGMCDESITVNCLANGERIVSVVGYWVSGSIRTFKLATNLRFIIAEVTSTATEITTPYVTVTWNYLDNLATGFDVVGACEDSIAAPTLGIRILDANSLTATLHNEATGAVTQTIDVSGIVDITSLKGIAYRVGDPTGAPYAALAIAHDKNVFTITNLTLAPDETDVKEVFAVRRTLSSDIDISSTDILALDQGLRFLELYSFDDVGMTSQIEERALSYAFDTVGLWRLEEDAGDALDSTVSGNDLTVSGNVTRQQTGKFGYAYKLDDSSAKLSGTVTAVFDPDNGCFSFWWKAPYVGYAPPLSAGAMGAIYTDPNNKLSISLTTYSTVKAEMYKGGVSTSVSYTLTDEFLDGRWHHILVGWDSNYLELAIDGVVEQFKAVGGVWAAGPTTLYIGSPAAAQSTPGYYDDVVLKDVWDTNDLYHRYELVTRGNKAYAFSGRDPTAVVTNFRNRLRRYFSEEVLSRDYNTHATTPDQVMADGEVIFREDADKLVLGDLGRTSRLFGLFIDRIVDLREYFLNHKTLSTVEDSYIKGLGSEIGASDVDENWNVEVKRRFLEVFWYCKKWRGNYRALDEMARFLGFRLWDPATGIPFIASRRKLDSCINPLRTSTPFDTSVFDSSDSSYQLVTLLLTLFKENASGSAGVTSIPATRELTDAGVTDFTKLAKVGSLLRIYDVDDSGDNGSYYVSAVTSSKLTVERDWPAGSLANLTYHLHWQVPEVDPYKDEVFSRLSSVKARWQKLGYQAIP